MPARILVSRCCFWCCLPLVRRPSRDIQIARFNFRFLSAPPPRLFCGLVIRHRDYTNSTLRRARFQLPPSLPPRLSLPLPPLSIGVPDGGGGGAILTRINDHANEQCAPIDRPLSIIDITLGSQLRYIARRREAQHRKNLRCSAATLLCGMSNAASMHSRSDRDFVLNGGQ